MASTIFTWPCKSFESSSSVHVNRSSPYWDMSGMLNWSGKQDLERKRSICLDNEIVLF